MESVTFTIHKQPAINGLPSIEQIHKSLSFNMSSSNADKREGWMHPVITKIPVICNHVNLHLKFISSTLFFQSFQRWNIKKKMGPLSENLVSPTLGVDIWEFEFCSCLVQQLIISNRSYGTEHTADKWNSHLQGWAFGWFSTNWSNPMTELIFIELKFLLKLNQIARNLVIWLQISSQVIRKWIYLII